jgi:hypothetical protein
MLKAEIERLKESEKKAHFGGIADGERNSRRGMKELVRNFWKFLTSSHGQPKALRKNQSLRRKNRKEDETKQ